jgi:hypothetical protein
MGFYLQGRRHERVEDLPLFPGTQLASPRHYSLQGNVLEVVEVKTGQEPDPKTLNRSWTGRTVVETAQKIEKSTAWAN